MKECIHHGGMSYFGVFCSYKSDVYVSERSSGSFFKCNYLL